MRASWEISYIYICAYVYVCAKCCNPRKIKLLLTYLHENIKSFSYLRNNEKIYQTVVCCRRGWRRKG